MTEEEMVGWHQQLNGYEFEQTPGGSEGQGSLEYYSPWDHKVRHDLATNSNNILPGNLFPILTNSQ